MSSATSRTNSPCLAEVNRQVGAHRVMVTYNGKSFDLPFLTGRSAYYGIELKPPGVHFDLLHFCRRAWRDELEGCSLRSIEQTILGISRETDLPGELVPEFYYEYLRTGNAGFLKPIVDHNRQDVISLVNVFSGLIELWAERDLTRNVEVAMTNRRVKTQLQLAKTRTWSFELHFLLDSEFAPWSSVISDA